MFNGSFCVCCRLVYMRAETSCNRGEISQTMQNSIPLELMRVAMENPCMALPARTPRYAYSEKRLNKYFNGSSSSFHVQGRTNTESVENVNSILRFSIGRASMRFNGASIFDISHFSRIQSFLHIMSIKHLRSENRR